MNVVLYSTHCPKCNVLEKKLKQKSIPYIEVNDIGIMKSKGFDLMPVLEVDGIEMSFSTANEWINNI